MARSGFAIWWLAVDPPSMRPRHGRAGCFDMRLPFLQDAASRLA